MFLFSTILGQAFENFLKNRLGLVLPGQFRHPALCPRYINFYYIYICKKK